MTHSPFTSCVSIQPEGESLANMRMSLEIRKTCQAQHWSDDHQEDDDLLTCGALKASGCWLPSSRGVGSWKGHGGGTAAVLLPAAVVGAALVISDRGGPRVDARVRGVVGLLPLGHLHHAVCFAHCGEQHTRAN